MEKESEPLEELSQYFYSKLVDKESQPALVLVQFYTTFYEKPFDAKLIPFFGRMVKLYGRNITYLALLDLFDFEDVNHANIHRLISYLIKRRIEGKFSIQENLDLTSSMKDYIKGMNKAKKQKIGEVEDPFDE